MPTRRLGTDGQVREAGPPAAREAVPAPVCCGKNPDRKGTCGRHGAGRWVFGAPMRLDWARLGLATASQVWLTCGTSRLPPAASRWASRCWPRRGGLRRPSLCRIRGSLCFGPLSSAGRTRAWPSLGRICIRNGTLRRRPAELPRCLRRRGLTAQPSAWRGTLAAPAAGAPLLFCASVTQALPM